MARSTSSTLAPSAARTRRPRAERSRTEGPGTGRAAAPAPAAGAHDGGSSSPQESLTLIQIVLNTRHHSVHKDLADAHAMHQRVMSLLPDALGASPRAATGTLHRLEETSSGPRLLVQTRGRITFDALPEGYSLRTRTLDMSPFLASLQEGQLLRYALIAHAAKSIKSDEAPKARGVRHTLTTREDLTTWWQQRAQQAGLELGEWEPGIESAAAVTGRRTGTDGQRQNIRHHARRFEGVAHLRDTTALRTALETGIGVGKAYGLGLLTVVPLKG